MWQALKNYYHLVQALAAGIFFNFPSRKMIVIGVTGTDGKTTTVSMIHHILKSAGKKVSMISSVNAQINRKSYETGFHVTTPSPWQTQKFLKKASDEKSEYFVLEATSHGLDQNRLAFIDFKVAVITNITEEHLDYHQTWENYALAKSKLFQRAEISVLNLDDKSYGFLKNRAGGRVITYSLTKKGFVNPKNYPLRLKLTGDYNLSNALAAVAATSLLGIKKNVILKALGRFGGVSGRMEEVILGQDFKAIIDFAHTPNALAQALKSLRSKIENNAKLIAVFGAAGERDSTKRSKMGEVAATYANIAVLTSEDPRTEKIEDICKQIARGLVKNKKKEGQDYYQIYDRQRAIEFAISLARKGDIVATFGKGHEKSMCYGKTETPWDELAVVRQAIKKRLRHP